jgi:beta-galactosidase
MKTLFHHFAISPFRHFTISPFRHFTISPFRHFTISLFHHFAISLFRHFAISLFLLSSAFAQLPDWENPELIGINNEPPHATFLPFDQITDALKNDWAASPYYMLLNGTWKFNWSENPNLRPVKFYEESYDVSGWKDIRVPSTIEIQGYGYPVYVGSA